MMINKFAGAVAATALATGAAFGAAAPASAANDIKVFGQQETLNDYVTGAPMIGYTVNNLSPSSDAIFHNGELYAATVTVEGLGGWATPLVPLFNARAESGQNYRVIGGGVAPAPPGGQSTGTLYFDVVGDVPNSVVYNDGTQDLLVWVSGSPEAGMATGGGAPGAPGDSSEIVGGGAADGGGEVSGNDFAPAPVAPAPAEVSPFETPEQHDRGH